MGDALGLRQIAAEFIVTLLVSIRDETAIYKAVFTESKLFVHLSKKVNTYRNCRKYFLIVSW